MLKLRNRPLEKIQSLLVKAIVLIFAIHVLLVILIYVCIFLIQEFWEFSCKGQRALGKRIFNVNVSGNVESGY